MRKCALKSAWKYGVRNVLSRYMWSTVVVFCNSLPPKSYAFQHRQYFFLIERRYLASISFVLEKKKKYFLFWVLNIFYVCEQKGWLGWTKDFNFFYVGEFWCDSESNSGLACSLPLSQFRWGLAVAGGGKGVKPPRSPDSQPRRFFDKNTSITQIDKMVSVP